MTDRQGWQVYLHAVLTMVKIPVKTGDHKFTFLIKNYISVQENVCNNSKKL